MANDIGMSILHNRASDMVGLFNFARLRPDSPAAKLVLTYRAAYQGMDACFTREDFWHWVALSADCDLCSINGNLMARDEVEGTL